ncbi:hypothetical protein PybrP1_005529 [[Pythium] brassicae (nom. inval.)]|nr:hypothetical protein PybrP1_005529 [[Pythium] brassicae (nom. inval.)]
MVLAGATHLLEFLSARDVAQLLLARSDAVEDVAAVWHWIASRARQHLPGAKLPHQAPATVLADRPLLVALLRRLHAVMTYTFELRFDDTRAGSAVRVADAARTVTSWGLAGCSIFGDRACTPNSVSYWECTGLSDGSHVGVAEEGGGGGRMRYGATFFQRALSMPAPACDHMPAVMYCESGFVTNGAFRGPRPRLPARASILRAPPCTERDRVGVFVDLLEGALVFVLNGRALGAPLPIDPRASYRPVFSARLCDTFRLIPDAAPPWRALYDLAVLLPASDDKSGEKSGGDAAADDNHAVEP